MCADNFELDIIHIQVALSVHDCQHFKHYQRTDVQSIVLCSRTSAYNDSKKGTCTPKAFNEHHGGSAQAKKLHAVWSTGAAAMPEGLRPAWWSEGLSDPVRRSEDKAARRAARRDALALPAPPKPVVAAAASTSQALVPVPSLVQPAQTGEDDDFSLAELQAQVCASCMPERLDAIMLACV